MTIHVTIGEAQARLPELIAAAVRGEDVVVAQAGEPPVLITSVAAPRVPHPPVTALSEAERVERHARRLSAFGMWKGRAINADGALAPIMTDEELEERWNEKFGPAA